MAKRKLEDNSESLLEAMQEVFIDCDEQKKIITETMEKRSNLFAPTDIDELCNLGKLENDSMRLLNDILDKKTKLLQIQAKLITSKSQAVVDNDDTDDSKIGLSSLDINEIRLMADNRKKENVYDLSQLTPKK